MSLHKYQIDLCNFILEKKRCALFADMGVGKTVITLTAINQILKADKDKRILIIAPPRVITKTWMQEPYNWSHLKHLKIVRWDMYERPVPGSIHVISNAKLSRMTWTRRMADTFIGSFDCIVLDELSAFKNFKSSRTRMAINMCDTVDWVIGLTGTPAPNGVIDLWSQIRCIDKGEKLGKYGKFLKENFDENLKYGHVVYEYKPKRGALEKVIKQISDIIRVVRLEDVEKYYDNHGVEYDNIYVELSEDIQNKYTELLLNKYVEIGDKAITGMSESALALKRLQFASGYAYGEDVDNFNADEYTPGDKKIVVKVHDRKLNKLIEFIDMLGENVMVMYDTIAQKDAILENVEGAELLIEGDNMERWNKGEVRVAVAHPASCGHGLNLQDGGRSIIWFATTYSLELYQQTVARLFRQNQQHKVYVYHLVTRNTSDEKVVKAIRQKGVTQEEIKELILTN